MTFDDRLVDDILFPERRIEQIMAMLSALRPGRLNTLPCDIELEPMAP
jgi:hypothetical protein